MRILGAIIEVAALPVLDVRQDFALGGTVTLQLVGYDHTAQIASLSAIA
jgi:hypothetical protein